MFRRLFLIATCAALLAACGGNNTNTATPAPATQQNAAPTVSTGETATPPEAVPTNGPRQYGEGTDEVQLPLTGTIVPPSEQDPDTGTLFDSVTLDQMGGVAGKELIVVVTS